MIEHALSAMHDQMDAEITRLRDLAEVNDHIKQNDIHLLDARQNALAAVIGNARVRLDAVRLIWKAPVS